MYERHSNREQYFNEQAFTTSRFVIPYIENVKKVNKDCRVLEIGCGEGGNLKPFAELQCDCTGVDLNSDRINDAKNIFQKLIECRHPEFILRDMYDVTVEEIGQFDIIMMRDVIEHIFNQEKFLAYIKRFLKPDGVIFFGFPPWQMPFGGHQQVIQNKWLSKTPYFHLLPSTLYQFVLRKGGVAENGVKDLLDIKQTGISIERFEKAVKDAGYQFRMKTGYFINPNYEVKFKMKTREKLPILGDIPYIRNFFTTCMYAIISH